MQPKATVSFRVGGSCRGGVGCNSLACFSGEGARSQGLRLHAPGQGRQALPNPFPGLDLQDTCREVSQ